MSGKNIGIAFSKEFKGNSPLGHIQVKRPVYMRLLQLCQNKGWGVYILTRKTYQGNGVFAGSWRYSNGKFQRENNAVKIDLVYDRCAGVNFPPEGDRETVWVNQRDFKILCWDKWQAYQEIGENMPKTFWLEKEKDISKILPKIKTDWVVLKPHNGLKGLGIFIGPKEEAGHFKFGNKFKHYIAQEFVDTSNGIPNITEGLHDLRVAIVNNKVVWSHVRIPLQGTYLANAAVGGILTEIDYSLVPNSIKKIVKEVIAKFSKKYDNPSYSVDFGVGKDVRPKIFEINDQIGFPKWEMNNRDVFLKELVYNFESKI